LADGKQRFDLPQEDRAMNNLCDRTEAKAFHPPEPKQTDGAALWAVIVIIALASVGLWIAAAGAPV
jgi:hypothetical protein